MVSFGWKIGSHFGFSTLTNVNLSFQDDEYLAALQADREKELKFMQEAERRQLEEAAAREASLERERHQEEENRRKMLEEEVLY